MAKIISMSLDGMLLEEMNSMQHELGFGGRSDMIRFGMKLLLNDLKEKEKLVGNVESLIILVHGRKAENVITETKHRFENIITTQIHSNLKNGKCLEIFVVNGDAEQIKKVYSSFQTNKKIDYVKLIVP